MCAGILAFFAKPEKIASPIQASTPPSVPAPTTAPIAPAKPEPAPTVAQPKGIGVTYEQVTDRFTQHFSIMKEFTTINGNPAYGFSDPDKQTTLTIIGPKDNIHSVSLSITPSSNEEGSKRDLILLSTFLGNVVPELENPLKWILSSIESNNIGMINGTFSTPTATYGEKLIKLLYPFGDSNLMVLSVEQKVG